MSKEKKGMPDEIMNQVRSNYKNFEDIKKREKESADEEETVNKKFEPGEGFNRVFSRMIGVVPEAPKKAGAPMKVESFNKVFSSLIGKADMSDYAGDESSKRSAPGQGVDQLTAEKLPPPVKDNEENASHGVSERPSVFERLSRAASEESNHENHRKAVEPKRVEKEPESPPSEHRISVFERLTKHKTEL